MLDWIFRYFGEDGIDDRVYQKKGGKMYIKSEEFVQSEEGQKLLKRFSENVETET